LLAITLAGLTDFGHLSGVNWYRYLPLAYYIQGVNCPEELSGDLSGSRTKCVTLTCQEN